MMLGMLLDQQVTMEWAFGAPLLLKQRLGVDHLDAAAIAAMDPGRLEAVFRDKPALHRYPASMAKRTHDLCRHIVEHYDGAHRRRSGTGATTGEELLARVQALPGSGRTSRASSSVCSASASACGRPGGEQVAADWPSIADVDTFERVAEIREKKRAAKAAKKAALKTAKAKRPKRVPRAARAQRLRGARPSGERGETCLRVPSHASGTSSS